MTTESTSADDAARRDGSALSEWLGARRRSAWPVTLHALEFVQYVAAVACVWVTLRTIVPGAIEWWQAAAMGGCSAIVAALYVWRK